MKVLNHKPIFYLAIILPGMIGIVCMPLAILLGVWFGFNDNPGLDGKILITYLIGCVCIDYGLLIGYLRKTKKEKLRGGEKW